MAIRIWSSLLSTDMNDPLNYSGIGALLNTDDLLFNGTSVIDVTATANLLVNSITITTGYTGAFNDSGYTFTIASTVDIHSGGAFTASGTWTQTGDADFKIYYGSVISDVSAWSIVLQGSGYCYTPYKVAFYSFQCANAGKTTSFNGYSYPDYISVFVTKLIIGAGNLNMVYCQVRCSPTTVGDLSFNIGHSIIGDSFSRITILPTTNNFTLPQINAAGLMGGLVLGNASNNYNINLGGDITSYFLQLGAYVGAVNTITTNNYSINVGTQLTLTWCILNCGSSNIQCGHLVSPPNYFSTINFDSSSWSVIEYISLPIDTIITGQNTTVITFTGTVVSYILSNAHYLPSIIIKKTGGSFSLFDNLYCSSFTVDSANTQPVSLDGVTLTTLDAFFDGIGSLDCGNGITCTNLTFKSVLGTITGTSCTATVSGDFVSLVNLELSRLIMNNPITRTITIGATKTLTLDNLDALNLNGSVGALTQWRSSSTGTKFNLNIPLVIALMYQNPEDCASNYVIDVTDGTSINGTNNINWNFGSIIPFFETYLSGTLNGENVTIVKENTDGSNHYIVFVDSSNNLRVVRNYFNNINNTIANNTTIL